MSGYTYNPHRMRELRDEEQAAEDERRGVWTDAKPGYTESETVYVIEYRQGNDPAWYSASPFYEPVRLQYEETHSELEAHEVAARILSGEWGVQRQRDPATDNITTVRVIERVSSAKIISQVDR